MKALLILLCLALPAAAGAADARTSIGLNYSAGSLDSLALSTLYPFHDWHTQRFTLDLRVPVSSRVEITLFGGYETIRYTEFDRVYTIKGMMMDSFGNMIGRWSEPDAYKKHAAMEGFSGGVSVRFYLGRARP